MAKRLCIFGLLTLIISILPIHAQVTTSGMSGLIMAGGETAVGATVQAVYEPSGTTYGTITNADGRFNLQGMRNGGPYRVTISYVGFQSAVYKDITLQLGETYELKANLHESSEVLDEVVVVASDSKFSTKKTGASTNISQEQMLAIPTVNRSVEDLARVSPYASGMGFAGGDGRQTNFTVDGANFNNNFGLNDGLPGGGNPISMDAIDEIQVVVAPFDVRQSNFIGGGINAVTKSGTNTFKGSAYTYQYNENMRGNRIEGESLGERATDAKHIYGATFGGPLIKNKLFFFANVEYEKIPGTLTNWRANNGQYNASTDKQNNISRVPASDLQKVSDFLRTQYGYDTGSFTDFPADENNLKLLGRIDWNIMEGHRLSVRYNYTKNRSWFLPSGNSSDTGYRLRGMDRVSEYSMSYANSCYAQDNKVSSVSADLNSRFSDNISNQLLLTYTNIQDIRDSESSPFPFIDIMAGVNSDGNQILEPYISAGYELFTHNNAVNNKIFNVLDNFTYYAGNHKITSGISFEHQLANNSYMRNGTGYYRYRSLDDFLSGAAPEAFALAYGYNGETNPNAEVAFNQIGLYAQDEWNLTDHFTLSYGLRLDNLHFDNSSLMRNNAIYNYDFEGRHIDTGSWPASRWQVSPRLGFIWDILGDNRLKVRGGTGLFAGRLPLVFFTNMPTNSGMIQNLVRISTTYNSDGTVKSRDERLDLLKGRMLTDVNEMITKLGLPATITPEEGVAPSSIAGVDPDFKMPQVWKSSIAVDYQLPTTFPFSVTGEFMFTKNLQAVKLTNYNIQSDPSGWERFNGADNRLIYPENFNLYPELSDACVLTNTSKGYGWTGNITLTAEPAKGLQTMLAYTHTESKEISGMPGNNASSAWSGLYTVNGPNFTGLQRSQYVVPDRVIASVSYTLPYAREHMATHLSLFYQGYSPYGNSFCYTNDMNGDGIGNDLIYIPKDDSEIQFKDEADRAAFWNFVNQDKYLKHHKGEYAEAYAARAPWVHRFDFRIAQDFSVKAGKTRNTLQISLDFLNIGNLFNSSWGVTKTNKISNNGRILTYEGKDSNNTPVFSLYRDSNGNAPTQTYSLNRDFDECWKFQVGVRYIFN